MSARPLVVKLIIFGIFVCGICLVVLNFISYKRQPADLVAKKTVETYPSRQSVPWAPSRIEADFRSDIQPKKLINNNRKLTGSKAFIRTYKIALKNSKDKNILVRQSGGGYFHVLLLHGQGSSSKVWEDIGTLQYLNKWGYRAFAIDIPRDDSNGLLVKNDKEAIQWLRGVIATLSLRNLVIISPSMSGRLTLPYLLQLPEQQQLIQGFVPIAPVGTENFGVDDYKKMKIPTLIVHGEHDTRFQSAFETLKQIPQSEILLIKNASHASYYEKPIEFHNALRQFLYRIYRPIYKNRFADSDKRILVSNTTKFKIKRTKKLQQ